MLDDINLWFAAPYSVSLIKSIMLTIHHITIKDSDMMTISMMI